MPPRKLSQAEKEFISKYHTTMTVEDMCADMPGIGPQTVQEFLDTEVLPEATPEETTQARHEKLRNTGLTAGKLMGRDPERGIVVMTPAASEMADAKRVVNVPSVDKSARAQPDRIFIMDKSKRVR